MGAKSSFLADPEPFFVPSPAFTVLSEHVPDEPKEALGIVCRACGCADLRVFKTRRISGGRIRRERVCRNCGKRTITTEHEAMR